MLMKGILHFIQKIVFRRDTDRCYNHWTIPDTIPLYKAPKVIGNSPGVYVLVYDDKPQTMGYSAESVSQKIIELVDKLRVEASDEGMLRVFKRMCRKDLSIKYISCESEDVEEYARLVDFAYWRSGLWFQ